MGMALGGESPRLRFLGSYIGHMVLGWGFAGQENGIQLGVFLFLSFFFFCFFFPCLVALPFISLMLVILSPPIFSLLFPALRFPFALSFFSPLFSGFHGTTFTILTIHTGRHPDRQSLRFARENGSSSRKDCSISGTELCEEKRKKRFQQAYHSKCARVTLRTVGRWLSNQNNFKHT